MFGIYVMFMPMEMERLAALSHVIFVAVGADHFFDNFRLYSSVPSPFDFHIIDWNEFVGLCLTAIPNGPNGLIVISNVSFMYCRIICLLYLTFDFIFASYLKRYFLMKL